MHENVLAACTASWSSGLIFRTVGVSNDMSAYHHIPTGVNLTLVCHTNKDILNDITSKNYHANFLTVHYQMKHVWTWNIFSRMQTDILLTKGDGKRTDRAPGLFFRL